MEKYFKLSEVEIAKIIAKEFKVSLGDVCIEKETVTRGYGVNEHQEDIIYAIVEYEDVAQ